MISVRMRARKEKKKKKDHPHKSDNGSSSILFCPSISLIDSVTVFFFFLTITLNQ